MQCNAILHKLLAPTLLIKAHEIQTNTVQVQINLDDVSY